jgi:hypothetical protein
MDSNRHAVDIAESLLRDASDFGFRPAFLDTRTFSIHLSRSPDGQPASLVPGFERGGFFYTARSVARAAAEWPCPAAD